MFSSLPGRQPITTASIVRTRLILAMPLRSPGRYGASWRLAITPSAPCSHGCASSGSSVAGVRSTGFSTSCPSRSRRSRLRQLEQHLVVEREQVEGDEARRRLLREHADARLRGVDPLAERVEVLAALVVEQHDLAVEHVAALGELQLGEVARHRLAAARLEVDLAAVDEGERPEAVPLGLVDPAVAERERLGGAGELREDGRLERQGHPAMKTQRPPPGGGGRRGRVLLRGTAWGGVLRSLREKSCGAAALGERGALVEAGAILGPVLRGERTEPAEGGSGECDGDEHDLSIGPCVPLL